MNLYESIFTRKSTRDFTATPLSESKIDELRAFIENVPPLLPDAAISYKIVGPEGVKGMGVPKAPHYILISAPPQVLRNTCAGFLFQHAELFLYAEGYATRWLGMLKSKEQDKNFVIGMAFGEPAKPEHRTIEEFDRKPLTEIVQGNDPRIEAARLAPSGLNGQPWYFIAENESIHVYQKQKIGGVLGLAYKMMDLDVGIALCHLAVASEELGRSFHFSITESAPKTPGGFLYLGTVK